MHENNKRFKIEPLLDEIRETMEAGLNTVMHEFLEKYDLYEENYEAMLNLPIFRNKRSMPSPSAPSAPNNQVWEQRITDQRLGFEIEIDNLQTENAFLKAEIARLKTVSSVSSSTASSTLTPVEEKENISLVIDTDADVDDNFSMDVEASVVAECAVDSEDNEGSEEDTAELLDAQSANLKSDLLSDAAIAVEEEAVVEEDTEEAVEEEVEEEVVEEEVVEEEVVEEEVVEEEVVEEEVVVEEVVVEEVVEEAVEEDTEGAEEAVEEDTEGAEEAVEEDTEGAAAEVETEGSEAEEEEEELFEIEIDDKNYCTNNDDSGFIYEMTEEGEVGSKVGYFKSGEPIFYNE